MAAAYRRLILAPPAEAPAHRPSWASSGGPKVLSQLLLECPEGPGLWLGCYPPAELLAPGILGLS